MLGFIESPYDPRDLEYVNENEINSEDLPEEYDCSEYYRLDVLDQGSTSTCVPHSLKIVFDTLTYDFNIDIYDIYDRRPNSPEDGMTIRDALKIIKKDINDPFFQYYRLRSVLQMKYSIVSNGGCIFALPVKSMYIPEFWKGNNDLGGHAICCVGYNKEGFILQNSWGYEFGDQGKCILPYSDIKYLMEAWGVI